MNRWMKLAGCLSLLILFGCASQTYHQLPRLAHPPKVIQSPEWTERLPRGSFRLQKPGSVTLLITGDALAGPLETKKFLKGEMKKALKAGTSGDLSFQYYMDGAGNLYRGRSDQFQGEPPMNLDPEGVIWVALLDQNLDLKENEGAQGKLVHLLTYLAFNYEMPDNCVKVMALTDEGRDSLLYEELNGTEFKSACEAALLETRTIAREIPAAPMWERSQRMRIHESDE